jgi:glycine/D-amino acid oxidase-like deaminating enzyme
MSSKPPADPPSAATGPPTRVTRRSVLKATAATLLAQGPASRTDASGVAQPARPHVVVVGAGAFGGWTALYLQRKGARVTLLDAWGPGNARASSGGELRITQSKLYASGAMYTNRDMYRPVYMEMVARSTQLWQEHQARWDRRLFHPCGAMTFYTDADRSPRDAAAYMREVGARVEELDRPALERRYPQINFDGVDWALLDVDGGLLRARFACQEVLHGFLAEGGTYRQVGVESPSLDGSGAGSVALSDGSRLAADQFVFACGPWLGQLFPGVVSIRATRHEVFFFGTPADDPRYTEDQMPICSDATMSPASAVIPGGEHRGMMAEGGPTKVRVVDPTTVDRTPDPELAAFHREYLGFRYPGMKDAPLLLARVCQFENSRDNNFIIDRHPDAENVWIVGGGSGHGFKHGPAIGERVAASVLGEAPVDPVFALARLSRTRA